MKQRSGFPLTAVLLCGLILSLLLVLIADGARFFLPKNQDRLRAEILLEDLDLAAAEALSEESTLSLDGSAPCRVLSIGRAEGMLRLETGNGRILSLPSRHRFSVKLTLLLEGKSTEDGFLAFGTRRILQGAQVTLTGARMTGKGRILSLQSAEE